MLAFVHWEEIVTSVLQRARRIGRTTPFIIVIATGTAACTDQRPEIERVAREFKEAWFARHGPRYYAMLAGEDANQLSPETAMDGVVAFEIVSSQASFFVLDSVSVLKFADDTAVVRFHSKGPGSDDRVVRVLSLLNAGQITRDSATVVLADLPQVSVIDSAILLREDDAWKAWIGVELARQFLTIHDSYMGRGAR